MKLYYAAAFMAFTLLDTGCMKQDYSDCDETDNFRLKFELSDGSGTGLTQNIKSIDALIFDDNNYFVTWERVDEDQLKEHPGIALTLDPGDYRVVCWGNLDNNTSVSSISGNSGFADLYIENVSGKSDYPLFYAPEKEISDRTAPLTRSEEDYDLYTVTVLPKQQTVKELSFTRVYRTVNVFLKGYEMTQEPVSPQVKINNMPVNYDFFLRTGPERRNYQTICRSVDTQEGAMLLASFDTPITDFTNEMIIEVIRDSDRETITTVDLRDYVQNNLPLITDLKEINIQVSYIFDGSVDITLPSWGGEPLEPQW